MTAPVVPTEPHSPTAWPAPRLALLLGTLVVPFAALLVAAWHERWYPSGDFAQAELHVRGFFRHPPLVGAAGRIGTLEHQGSHPGPSMWVALLPTYLLFGRTANGLMVAMTVLQFVSIVASVWLARKVGGLALAVATLGVLVVATHAAGPHFFLDPWNPWAAVVPFMAFLLLVTLVVDGRHRYLPWAVLVGSHCVQSHVGYAPLVGGLLGAAVVVAAVREVRAHRGAEPSSSTWRPIAWSLAALLAMWLAPVVDQLRRDPGNLRILWTHFTEPDAPSVGPWRGFQTFAAEFNVFGGWALGPRRSDGTPFWPGFVVMVALFGLSFALAVRRRRQSLAAFHAVVAFAALVGLVAISRIFGDFFEYTYRWMWMIAGAAVAAILTTGWREAQRLAPLSGWHAGARRAALVTACAVVAAAGVASTVNAATADVASLRDSRLIGGVSDEAAGVLDDSRRYLVRWHDPFSLGGVGFGTLLELERQGFDVGVDAWASAAALPNRVRTEDEVDAVLWVVTGDTSIESFRGAPGAVEVAWFDQRSPEEVVRSVELRRQLEQELIASGHGDLIPRLDVQHGMTALYFTPSIPPGVRTLAGRYADLREPIAIFELPPFVAAPA